jgi:hypothetical protein
MKQIMNDESPFPHLIHINATAGVEDYEAVPGAAGAWHSEVSWARRPPMATMLLGREVPPVGGDTMFCDAYAMYEVTPPLLSPPPRPPPPPPSILADWSLLRLPCAELGGR